MRRGASGAKCEDWRSKTGADGYLINQQSKKDGNGEVGSDAVKVNPVGRAGVYEEENVC